MMTPLGGPPQALNLLLQEMDEILFLRMQSEF
jgi:hypothetical protein